MQEEPAVSKVSNLRNDAGPLRPRYAASPPALLAPETWLKHGGLGKPALAGPATVAQLIDD